MKQTINLFTTLVLVVILATSSFGQIADKLLFYDATNRTGELYGMNEKNCSIQNAFKANNWRNSWSQIVSFPMRQACGTTGILFYEKSTGQAEVYNLDHNNKLTFLRRHNGFRKTWDKIIAMDELMLFYDKSKGEAELYYMKENGDLELKKKYSGWRKSWDIITAAGYSKGYLVFYEKASGTGEIYSFDQNKNLKRQHATTGWRKTWSHIEYNYNNVVFFDRNSSAYEVYSIGGYQSFEFKRKSGGILPDRFDEMICLTQTGNGGSVLFYNKRAGKASLYHNTYNRGLTSICTFNGWRKTWDRIICSDYDISCLK